MKFYPIIKTIENLDVYKNFVLKETPEELNQLQKAGEANIESLRNKRSQFKGQLFRFGVLIMLGCFSIFKGEFTSILGMVGCIGGMLNQFVLPPFIYERYFGKKVSIVKSCINIMTMLIGMLGASLGIYTSA